jgi:hypothetical protein
VHVRGGLSPKIDPTSELVLANGHMSRLEERTSNLYCNPTAIMVERVETVDKIGVLNRKYGTR